MSLLLEIRLPRASYPLGHNDDFLVVASLQSDDCFDRRCALPGNRLLGMASPTSWGGCETDAGCASGVSHRVRGNWLQLRGECGGHAC
jgi:hypothetical protein